MTVHTATRRPAPGGQRFKCAMTFEHEQGRVTLAVEVTDLYGHRRIQVDGATAALVADQVDHVLRSNGVRSHRRRRAHRPFEVTEAAAVQAELLLRAVAPLRRAEQITAVAQGVTAMSVEEAYYWFSKCWHNQRGYQALRLLLADPDQTTAEEEG